MTLGALTEDNILNAVRWFDRVGAAGGTVANSVQLVFELLCTRDADALTGDEKSASSSSAWPRPRGMMNTIICAAGCAADESGTNEEFETATQLIIEAPELILSSEQRKELGGVRTAPNAVETYHDLNGVCYFLRFLPFLSGGLGSSSCTLPFTLPLIIKTPRMSGIDQGTELTLNLAINSRSLQQISRLSAL